MKIFIDEGHNYGSISGSWDTGAEGNGLKEQDITFAVGHKLGKLLSNKGILVKHSRNEITDVVGKTLHTSIAARYIMANEWLADYFVSLHCDSSLSSFAKGSHVCVYTKGGIQEKLGQSIQNELLKLGLDGRSQQIVERKDLGVLKYSKMPAILVEMGFISNKDNAYILANKQDELAFAIYKGICNFLGIDFNVDKSSYSNPSVIDCTNELLWRGLITDQNFWNKKAESDEDIKWLFTKYYSYIMKNGGSIKDRNLSSDEAIQVLQRCGIISEYEKWNEKAWIGKDDVYWLLINMANYVL